VALKIYPAASPDDPYSQSGTMTNPMRHGFDGRVGRVVETKYYLRNDSALAFSYTSIVIDPIDESGMNITDSNGFSWKLSEGDTQPTSAEWDVVTDGDAISMSDLLATAGVGDTSTYLPFWLRIEVPRGASVASYNDVILRITATETAV